MVDDSKLDYIRTFLGKCHTMATVKHVGEHGPNIDSIVDASYQRILVHPGELIGYDGSFYTERYLVKLSESSEANLTNALNNIIDGINNLNRRVPIGHYIATYSFEDEDVGTEGTDIDFVDSATLFDGECIIVDEWQGHKKILRVQDDATAAEDPQIEHDITQAMSGTHEFWFGTDNIIFVRQIRLFEGVINIQPFKIEDSKWQYRASGGVWIDIIDPAVKNTLYHIKFTWRDDGGTTKWSLWIDEILKVDDQTCYNDQSSGVNTINFGHFGDTMDYFYIDAYGETEDPNYNVGDNLIDYTKPDTLAHASLANGKQSFKNFSTNRWYKDIYLDFEWSTS